MIVVDSKVVAELMRPSPAATVVSWVRGRPGPELYTTAITVAEVRYGMERLPAGRRREQLASMAEDVFATFDEQVLPLDRAAALEYSRIVSARDHAGLPIDGFDAQIAAICRAHGATLVTRNVKDFDSTGVHVIDPWREI